MSDKTQIQPAGNKLSLLAMLVFAFPALPHAFIVMPLLVVLPSFYAAHTTVTLAQIATIATMSRLIDAFADPVVGYLSDMTRTRLGARKPWMLAVVAICPVAILYLFQPPSTADAAYFTLWSFCLYIGFAMFEIPRHAWGAELTRDYAVRSRLWIFVAVANISGSLVFWLLPLALQKMTGTTAITGETLTGISWMYFILMPLGLGLGLFLVPNGERVVAQKKDVSVFRALLRSVRHCRPLWRYLTVIGFWGLGQGAFLSTTYIFMNDYMRLGDKFAVLMILYFIVQLAALPVWSWVLKRIDRHRLLAFGLVIDALLKLSVLLIPTGPEAYVPVLGVIIVTAFFNSPSNFLPTAILGDVIDYDTLKTKQNKGANFYAINTLMIKVTMAIGAGAGFAILALANYKVGKANDATAQLGLLMAYIALPAVTHFLGGLVCWNFPLTRARHDIVRRKLQRWKSLTI